MDKTKVTLSAAVALLAAGQLYQLVDDKPVQVELVQPADAVPAVEVTGAPGAAIAKAYADAGARGDLLCQRGAIANHPNRVYCTDGGTAGFLLEPGHDAALQKASRVRVADGKAYAAELPEQAQAGGRRP